MEKKKIKEVKYTVRAKTGVRYKRAIMRMVNDYAGKHQYNNIYALWLLVKVGYDFWRKDLDSGKNAKEMQDSPLVYKDVVYINNVAPTVNKQINTYALSRGTSPGRAITLLVQAGYDFLHIH